jgi:signal peptidase II
MSKYVSTALVAAVWVILDQATKWYVRATVPLYQSVPVIDGVFSITHVHNTGGAFSLFAAADPAFRLPFFLLVSAVAIAALLYFVYRADAHHHGLLLGLGLILGGALGNLIDRMAAGEVTDFFDLHWRGYVWPAFNVADAGITVGMIILLLHSFLAPNE